MQITKFRKMLYAGLLVSAVAGSAFSQSAPRAGSIYKSSDVLLQIVRAEDERRWSDDLRALFSHPDRLVRRRAVLAAGRIGDERALPSLFTVLKEDRDTDVRQMAAFAIGEIESLSGAGPLYTILSNPAEPRPVSARAVEALGKIAAALPESDQEHRSEIGKAILGVLRFEGERRVNSDRLTVLLALTAALRAKSDGAGPVVAQFLDHTDPRIVSDALNTMARLRLKDRNDRVRQLLNHADPIVRANAARVIGVAEDKAAYDAVLNRALTDSDVRVRVSAVRALGSLKDSRVIDSLLARGNRLISDIRTAKRMGIENPPPQNELVEVAAALGRSAPALKDLAKRPTEVALVAFFTNARSLVNYSAPEIEIAFARVAPADYLTMHLHKPPFNAGETSIARSRRISSLAQGLGEIAALKPEPEPSRVNDIRRMAQGSLASWLCIFPESRTQKCVDSAWLRQPETFKAYAAFKPGDLSEALRPQLLANDVVIRATAADLLGDQPPNEANARALISALPRALRDQDLNDAALSILDSLAKQKSEAANNALKTALDSQDQVVRRRAVSLLKANGAGDFSSRLGATKTRNTPADYRRALARIGSQVTATVITRKGPFTIEFLPEEAPLTVDNFIQLARRGYFNGQIIPRVVPNFVVQAGDPRGDQNGGPGYQIRCELNEVPFERGSLGMALSGKDTGGSQWFVTHSPQPHLDGGYTVFGRVIRGLDVVDSITRGDTIRRVIVNER